MIKQKFITNLALLITLNLLVKPLYIFGIDRIVQNTVGPEHYGLYFSLFNFSLLFNIFLDIGITNYNNRNVARDKNFLLTYFSNIVMLKFLLALGYACICLITGIIIGYDMYRIKILSLLIFNQFLASYILYFRSNISGMHLFRIDSLLSVADRMLMILLCGLLLWMPAYRDSFRIEWFIYTQTVSYAVTAFVAFIIVYRKAGGFRLAIDINILLKIARESSPFALLTLLMSFGFRADSVLLERLLPDGTLQAGIYAQAFRILDALLMFAFLFSVLLLPMFSRMISNRENIEQLTTLAFSLLFVPSVCIAAAVISYRYFISDLLYDNCVAEAAPLIGITMVTFIFNAMVYIFGTLLTAHGSLAKLNIIYIAGLMINITANWIFIPIYKAEAAAWISLITQAIVCFAQIVLSVYIFSLRIDTNLLIRYLSFIIFMVSISLLMRNIAITWLTGFCSIVLAGIIFAFIIRILNLRSLLTIVRQHDEI